MIRQSIIATSLAAAWLVASASIALAHSFNVVMIVPTALSQEVRADMVAAFLVASEERDSHANEESDGHLGGLDVYITLAGSDQSARIAGADADIAIVMPGVEAPSGDAVAFTPAPADSAKAADFLASASAPGLEPFAARFGASKGAAPGPEATLAYIAARQIDLAVLAQGSTDDRGALTRALEGN